MRDVEDMEIERIRSEYARRNREIPRDFYGWNRPANQFSYCQTLRAIIGALAGENRFPLDGYRVADIGCGNGTWLLEFAQWGADADGLAGIDLDGERIEQARRKIKGADLRAGDARSLPWPDSTFDLVSALTLFTSILNPGVKKTIAREMLRVLKPDGIILWYDFHYDNPRNASVRGIELREIRSLFSGCVFKTRHVTLAPPIGRVVVPVSWIAGLLLEKLPFLCTHYLEVIRKADAGSLHVQDHVR